MTGTLLSLGHGYSARALAATLQPQGWQILGTTRNPETARQMALDGIEPIMWEARSLHQALDRATHLLTSVAPTPQGDPALDILGPAIAARASELNWAGYLSTTGVYGDHNGGWVTEDTPLTPCSPRGEARVRAETAWQAIPDLPLHIFRLAGIYGPGRGPFAKLRNGTARRIIKENQVFSRIHADDIAQTLALSLQKPNPGAAYNLCDNDPAPPQDVIAYAADLLGLPQPEAIAFEKADMSPMARSFYGESKRVSNARIKSELGVKLIHPDYRTGLKAVLDAEQA